MPILDLVDLHGDIDPLAIFHILTIMVHPANRERRRSMIATLRQDISPGGRGRRPPSPAEFIAQAGDAAGPGGVAGDMLIRLIEIDDEGRRPSLNEAFERTTVHLSSVAKKEDDEDRILPGLRNKQAVLAAWRQFQSVAHYWAAFVQSQGEGGSGSDMMDSRNLPRFVSQAAGYAVRGMAIWLDTRDRHRAPAIDPQTAWRLKLPGQWNPHSAEPPLAKP